VPRPRSIGGDVNFEGFVPRPEVLEALGFGPGYKIRGFGRGSGLKRLAEDQYQRLLTKFLQRPPT
jgi:hypothetical protein